MVTRRCLLKTSAGGVLGLAGCITVEDTLAETTVHRGDGFAKWLVDPARIDRDHYWVLSTTPVSVADHSQSLDHDDWNDYQEFYIDRFRFTQFAPNELDRVTIAAGGFERTTNGFDVISGDFDAEQIIEHLRRADYRSRQEYEDFDLYTKEDDQSQDANIIRAVGVSDDTIVSGSGNNINGERLVQYLIDTAAGEEQRYSELNSDFEVLLETTPTGDLLGAGTGERVKETDIERGQFQNLVGRSYSVNVNSDESEIVVNLVFLDERDVINQDIEEWTERDDTFRKWRNIDISTDGRLATVKGQILTRELFEGPPVF